VPGIGAKAARNQNRETTQAAAIWKGDDARKL